MVRWVNPLEVDNWDQQLLEFPESNFFHSQNWARVLQETYDFKPVYGAVFDKEGLLAVIPLMEVVSKITGRRGIGLPFTDHCAPLCRDREMINPLVEQIIALGKERRWKHLEMRGGIQFFPKATPSVEFYHHTLDLTPGRDVLWKNLSDSTRRAVRKAERQNIRIEISQSMRSVEIFYALHCQTRKRQGFPPPPFKFFKRIQACVLTHHLGNVFVAWHQKMPIAAAVFCHFGSKCIFKYGASDKDYQHLRPNNLLLWHAIQSYAEQQFTTMDLGRTSHFNEGLRRFKRGLGTQESKLSYLKYDLKHAVFLKDTDLAGSRFKWLFHLMPEPLLRKVGTVCYRHIA